MLEGERSVDLSNENVELTKEKPAEKDVEFVKPLSVKRIALAQLKDLPAPKLGSSLKSGQTIDLATDEDDPTKKWFNKTFGDRPVKQKKQDVKHALLGHVEVSKNHPSSLRKQARLREILQKGLAVKRREGLEQRKKLYEMENEHLKAESDEEEEKRKKKKKKKVKQPDEYDSEDDSDYKEEEEEDEQESEHEEELDKELDKPSSPVMNMNVLNDSFTFRFDRNNLDESFGDFHEASPRPENVFAVNNDLLKDLEMGDLLSLCSGRFGSMSSQELEDVTPLRTSSPQIEPQEEEDDEEEVLVTKKRRQIESDDEEEPEKVETPLPETIPFDEDKDDAAPAPKRVIIDEDDDEEEDREEEEEGDDEEEEEDVPEEDEEGEDLDERPEEEEEETAPPPNFDDEEDELAYIKRQEYTEMKRKEKKKNFFDDEASLSGDDVGSDIDENELGDEYEAEEGDADDLPDSDTIRRENHRLLLKQENDKEQRALLKLQDKLLTDGDLGATETNRTFRFRLREEVVVGESNEDEKEEEEEEEETEEAKAERARLIKFRLEMAEVETETITSSIFERTTKVVKAKEFTVLKKPSLLSRMKKNTINDVLAQNAPAPKQLYTQHAPTVGVKRSNTSPTKKPVGKKAKSMLSGLEM